MKNAKKKQRFFNYTKFRCTKTPGGVVDKRYPETTRLAALSEVQKTLKQEGIAAETQPLLDEGKKFAACIHSCLAKKTDNCVKKLK